MKKERDKDPEKLGQLKEWLAIIIQIIQIVYGIVMLLGQTHAH